MKPTLLAIAIGCPLLAGVIPTAHAVECAAGVIGAGCTTTHRAAARPFRAASFPATIAGINRRHIRLGSPAGSAARVVRANTATKAVLTGCALRESACHRHRARQVTARGAISLAALTLTGESPASVISDFGTRALAAMRNGDTEAARQEQFRFLYRQYFDTQACARSALGSYWQNATAQQRHEFVDRYEDYVVIGYSLPLGQLGGESFTVLGSQPDNGGVVVTTLMNRTEGAAPIEFDWHLNPTDNGYKVTNVIVSGIDMANMQRSDVVSVIQRNSGQVQVLLAALREKNASNGILR